MLSRRKMLNALAGIPLMGTLATAGKLADPQPATKASKIPNLFERLGIEPVINARGTMTFLSGSLMLTEVVEAIQSTSIEFTNMYEVQNIVGERIA